VYQQTPPFLISPTELFSFVNKPSILVYFMGPVTPPSICDKDGDFFKKSFWSLTLNYLFEIV